MMAYVTRYIFGTDKLRANSFEVRGMNGSNTGVIHVADLAVLSKWMKIISEYTNALSGQKVYEVIKGACTYYVCTGGGRGVPQKQMQ